MAWYVLIGLLSCLFIGLLPTHVLAGAESSVPFGFDLFRYPEGCIPGTHGGYQVFMCTNAPRAHPDIQQYFLQYMEGVGLCGITAFSFIEDQLERRYELVEKFLGQLTQKYGSPTKRFKSGQYSWHPDEGFQGQGEVKVISLGQGKIPRVWVVFVFRTHDDCETKQANIELHAF